MAVKRTRDVVIRFLTDTSQLNKGLKETEGVLTSLSKKINTSSGHLSTMKRKVDQVPKSANIAGKALKELGTEAEGLVRGIPVIGRLTTFINNIHPAAKIAAVSIGLIAGSIFGMVRAGAEAETQLTSMSVLLKQQGQTMNQTKEFYRSMINLASETPLASGQVTDAAKRLLAVEVPMGKVRDMIKTIGDVSAGSGKNFIELVDIIAKNKTSQIIQGEDINQLAGAGIPILAEFSRMTGKTAQEIKKMGAEGRLTYDMLIQAMQNMSGEGGLFENMMVKQSKTIRGLWSTIRDDIGMTWLFMSGALADEGTITFMSRFKDIMSDIATFTGSFFRENQGRFQALGTIIGNILTILWQTGKTVYDIFKPAGAIIFSIVGLVVDIGLAMAKWGTGAIITTLRGVASIFTTIYETTKNIAVWFYNFSGIAAGVTIFMNKIDDFIASIKLGIFFTNLYIKSVFASWSQAIDDFLERHSLIKGVIDVLTGKDTGEESRIQRNNQIRNDAASQLEAQKNKVSETVTRRTDTSQTVNNSSTQNVYNINNVQNTQFFNTDKEKTDNFSNLSGQPGY